jgi:hypothetical protein
VHAKDRAAELVCAEQGVEVFSQRSRPRRDGSVVGEAVAMTSSAGAG